MKTTANRLQLLTACERAAHAAAKKATLPVLEYLLIDADSDALRVTGTDLELFVRKFCAAQIIEPGAVGVPAKRLLAFLRAVDGETVAIEYQAPAEGEHIATVQCGRHSVKLPALPKEEFPPFIVPTGPQAIVNGAEYRRLVGDVAYAVSSTQNRPVLTGICAHIKDGRLILVAADGCRLAIAATSTGYAVAPEWPTELILPAKAAEELADISKAEDAAIILVYHKVFTGHLNGVEQFPNSVYALCGDTEVYTQCVDGHYVDYAAIIPEAFANSLSVDPVLLAKDIAMAAKATDRKPCDTRIDLARNGDTLHLGAAAIQNETTSEFESDIPCTCLTGDTLAIALNASFMLDVLHTLAKGARLIISTNGAGKVALLQAEGSESIHLIAPLKEKS